MIPRTVAFTLLASIGLAITSVTTAVGVQTDIDSRLKGKWQANADATRKYAADHEDAETLPDQFLDDMPKIVFEFAAEGKAHIAMDDPTGESRTLDGAWELVEEKDADHAVLKVTMQVNGQDDAKNVTLEFIDDDTVALAADDQPTLVFVRVKDDAEGGSDDKSDSDGKRSTVLR